MADTVVTKKVTDLTESTAPSDEDLFVAGSAGTASLRKIKWSNIWNKILTLITDNIIVNNLVTTVSGKALDARQGKALDDKITELNTKIDSIISEGVFTGESNISGGSAGNLNTASIAKDGYKALFAIPAYSTNSGVIAQGCTFDKANNKVSVAVKNLSNSQVSGVKSYVYVYYIKL
ncbi:MAG: hypothetical protein SOX32_12805 [Candidatus Choladocola sp.]|nr:hypothetical protein [Candidatus Choladocola sp.]